MSPRALLATMACCGLLLAAGCAEPGGQVQAVGVVVQSFYAALDRQDGQAACSQLAPFTAATVAQSARQVDVFGHQGRVLLAQDTVFVSHLADGWKITAAGCTARRVGPYDCEIQGG